VQQEPPTDQTLEQVWFAGVHCDVGGGYSDPSLSEIPLLWMIERARAHGLAFDPERLELVARDKLDPKLRAVGVQVAPDPLGQIHDSFTSFYKLAKPYDRPLAADGGFASSTAVARREGGTGYGPKTLASYLDGGGKTMDVRWRRE
jgi:hypothetical protein